MFLKRILQGHQAWRESPNAAPTPSSHQFLMADQQLKRRLHQLLHETPDFERLMSAAWNNTTTSLGLDTRAQYFNARAALYLTQEYEKLRRSHPELINNYCDCLHNRPHCVTMTCACLSLYARHQKRTETRPQRPGLGTGTPRGHGTKAHAPREGNPTDAYPTHQPERHVQAPTARTQRDTHTQRHPPATSKPRSGPHPAPRRRPG